MTSSVAPCRKNSTGDAATDASRSALSVEASCASENLSSRQAFSSGGKTASFRGVIRLALPLAVVVMFAFGFLAAPNDPVFADASQRFQPPSAEYPLGTDSMGRCLLSRLLYGGTTTIGIVLAGCAAVAVVGTACGLGMASPGHRGHLLLESLLDAVVAIPPIAYLIIFIAAWGNGVITMLVAVTASLFLRLVKLVKTRADLELGRAYVLCAEACGASRIRVLLVHVLPNVVRDVTRFVCMASADMVLAITSFSFVGLGMGDNVVDWGIMVADGHHYIVAHPTLIVYPVICIVLVTVSLNLLARAVDLKDGPDA